MPTKLFKTQCTRDCPDACYMDVEVREGRIVSVTSGKENPVTNGFVCPRGAGDPRRVYSESRVLYPRIREGHKPGGSLRRVSWEEALGEATRRLGATIREEGPGSVLLLDNSGNAGLVTSEFGTRLWGAIGATRTNHSICSRSGHEALKLHYGLSYGVAAESLPGRKMITFWGFNARVSSAHQWALAMKARENGAPIVVVDPRRSESAEAADLWLRPRPGTDVALAYGVARCLIERSEVDKGFMGRWTVGFEAYRDEAMRWTPERVESLTGLERSQVESFAGLLADRRPGAVMMGIGFQKSAQGAEAIRAVSLLPALLGEHRGFYYSNSRGRLVDYGYLSDAGHPGEHRTVSQTTVGGLLRGGAFKYVYVVGMNPVLTLPDLAAVREGLSREDVFVVVHDTHMTETCGFANVVLPAATFLEKEDVALSDCHVHTRLGSRCIEPLGESRSEVWVMREMARRLGHMEGWLYEEPREALRRAFEGALVDGMPMDLLGGADVRVRERPREEYQTPSGRIEFASSTVGDGITSLPRQLPVEEDKDTFVLLNSALPQWTHSQFRDVYGGIPLSVWVNVEDAERLDVRDGEPVLLWNELGEIELKASVGERVRPGVLWSPRPLIDGAGRSQNALIPGVAQALGGGPLYNSARVRLRKA